MIIWTNGPFGGGKTTLAALLHQHLDGAITTDPEEVGFLLCKSIGDDPGRQKDFQDYPMWRELVARICAELDRFAHEGPIIAPMTLLRRKYATTSLGERANTVPADVGEVDVDVLDGGLVPRTGAAGDALKRRGRAGVAESHLTGSGTAAGVQAHRPHAPRDSLLMRAGGA
ncbi:ATP/GTP-binding protein [Streptomyces sp. NPDC050535]|uniref:ATP/GTP-binding protein n=1 Tax=Streptomyces sp. NPDC050535 TaxID=3365626 RepID=UPI0037A27EFB